MTIQSQLLKGVLEGSILAIVKQEPTYGYELALKLHKHGLDVSEGSIYPILLRLQKEKLITSERRPSPSGPSRKYYMLTDLGEESLATFKVSWQQLEHSVDSILKGGDA
ncbi:PadR family transcriptional regulator [Paenalkalicoccus suaedae]|uniref:PadR family transcriptional regulator n=1 Tax=Paenalkalicoccus suaedae TaxID=2592382 RepID=A0A859FBC9_9BACI|nr:PadR family transcriptional regulator [Paenalkalicoccus suaedae]QKS69981.1 PadR family transcriptional regulator [Paenalkalicoccus suaedae]